MAKKFKEFIKTETIVIGSLRNNDNIVSKVKKKRKSIAFVSTGYPKKNHYELVYLNNKLKSDLVTKLNQDSNITNHKLH